jgi:hypothetical protein
MITDLFAAVSSLEGGVVRRVVPPACRREPSPVTISAVGDTEVLLEFPEWRPRVPARHFLPCFSLLTGERYTLRFELSVWAAGTWSPWVATVTLGPGEFTPLRMASDALVCDVDVYRAPAPVERVKLRIRLGAADPRALMTAPWIATLSASDLAALAAEAVTGPVARLAVPARSQLDAPPEIALRICSPTSVAMVLDFWGRPSATLPLAAEIYHPGADSYGVWPAAVQNAGRHGVAGYLLRFPDWSSAAWCLGQRLPIIASINYAAGELTDAAIPETTGHLVVVTGAEGDDVFVNDPVGPTVETVPRRYRLNEFRRAWLERAGVGYVLFRPDRLNA